MAQFSRPQPGLFPADGDDCGAYTANEWAAVLIAQNMSSGMMVTGAASPPGLPGTQVFPNVGVYYVTPNQLVVTSPGASQISIDTGAAIVDGRVYTNDTAISAVAITNPAANPRIDRVVVRQNYTAIDYTSVNAPALIVDANTARIAIISGAENVAPVAPALTQDEDRATYWDIPLAQYQIAVAGTITNLTDEREFVDAETKRLFVNVLCGYDNTGGASAPITCDGTDLRLLLVDGNDYYGSGRFCVPNDFISGMTSTAVTSNIGAGAGNIYCSNAYSAGACGQAESTHTGTTGLSAVATTANVQNCLQELSLASVAVDDIVLLSFDRDAANVLDTVNADVRFYGWIVDYFGWGRR